MTSTKPGPDRPMHGDLPQNAAAAMDEADAICAARGLRMTSGRRKVLGMLLKSQRPLGAYDIIALHADEGRRVQPAIVYRALQFLAGNGFAHRIERLNAYVACMHPGERHAPAFLICRTCQAVEEACISSSKGALGTAARAVGFRIERVMVEAEGICPNCADGAYA